MGFEPKRDLREDIQGIVKPLCAFVSTLKTRVFAYATMEDHFLFNILSPAVRSLRIADGFVRNVFVLLGGTTLAMIIPTIASPVLTRLYTPHDFGVFALYVSIVSVIAVPLTGNYDSAIMLPKEDEDAFNLIGVCLAASLSIGVVLLILSLLFGREVGTLLGNRYVSPWLWLAPLTAFVMGLQQTLSYWANRKRQFKRLGTNKVIESTATPVVTLALGLRSWGVGGLIAGLLVGKAAATWMLGRGIWEEKRRERLSLRGEAMLEQGKRYSDFPVYSAPTSFLDVFALQIPVLLLTKFFSPAVVGLFALTTRVMGAPLMLVGTCVGQVYYQWISEAAHRGADLRFYVMRVAKYLVLIASGPVIAAVLFSPVLFRFVFGSRWGVAGEYARILVFPLAIKFIVAPLAAIMPASGNIRLGSVWKMIYFCSTAIVLFVAAHFPAKTFLCIYGAHEMVLYGFYFFLILKASTDLRLPGSGSTRSGGAFEAES